MKEMIKFSSQLKKKLSRLKVGIVYVFGSRVRENRVKKNDLDLGVVFSSNPERTDSLNFFFSLYKIFSREFPKENIDIVLLQFAPIDFQFEVIKFGKALFETESKFRMDYEEIIIRDYLFFEPLLREYKKVTLETFL